MTEKLTFMGIVQGIGFRPACQRIAIELGVKGQVKNSGGNVELIITCNKEVSDEFIRRLALLFDIRDYKREIAECAEFDTFKIVHSDYDNKTALLTPDLATCGDCERELKDKNNRRFMHPFISCVNCGPRYTIMNTLPYDRENTAMAQFEMCNDCMAEYKSADNRRCHAQTIACKGCGPEISISIDDAVDYLNQGKIIAVKDIGGYHLVCKADEAETVLRLRQLKGREKKPFAVMFSSTDEIKEYCNINDTEKELLTSTARPIVLLEKKKEFYKAICDDSDFIGAFLPCNPIQIMLLDKLSPLVMTSANISGEPIITNDDEIAKFGVPVLSHNRAVLTSLDDSVLQVVDERTQFIRRARGYVPLAIDIGVKAECDTLLMGGDLKAVFGIHRDKYVFLSQYFGDLEDKSVFEGYKENIQRFSNLHGFCIEKVVCDSHPDYYSSNIFSPSSKIQHHKAHIASVIAEHRLKGDVLGFAFDGTGFGDDGAIWGSEAILFDGRKFERKEHLDYIAIPASDEISKNADLALACYLGGNQLIDSAVKSRINTISSSSMGRLFDAVAALLDICHYNEYEGQCAMALESLARKAEKPYPLSVTLNPVNILNEIKEAIGKTQKEEIALGFHIMLCKLILSIAEKHDIHQIVLSGGVFNNRILTKNTVRLLEENGFSVYINEKVPNGDGGIALGQAYIAAMED